MYHSEPHTIQELIQAIQSNTAAIPDAIFEIIKKTSATVCKKVYILNNTIYQKKNISYLYLLFVSFISF